VCMYIGTSIGVISLCLVFGLPAAVAMFPETLEVKPTELEERFHSIGDAAGQPYPYLKFNKGL
jgi:hypothetical protein